MKKALSFLFFLCFSICAYSQTKHLEFMGMPLDGSISNFEQKLFKKGMTSLREFNAVCDYGLRGFKGTFAGFPARIFVYFDYNTQLVYRAEVYFSNDSVSEGKTMFQLFSGNIDDKYSDWKKSSGTRKHLPKCQWESQIGTIEIYVDAIDDDVDTIIGYEDAVNKEKHEISQMNDI